MAVSAPSAMAPAAEAPTAAMSADGGDGAGDHLHGSERGALVVGEEVVAGDGVVDVVGGFDGGSDGSGARWRRR